MPGATSAAGSAPATARTTTRPDASARARRRAISRCRPTRSCPTPRSRSAEGPYRQWPLTNPTYRPTSSIGKWMDARLPVARMMHAQFVDFPTPAQPQLPVDDRRHPHLLPRRADRHRHRARHALRSRRAADAFNSVEHIRRDVNYGWLMRNLHAVGASMFFLAVYIHIGRGLYYGSYKAPREVLWIIGVVILLLMMATAFMGYSLPWGQMSFWAVTVITNLFSSVDSIVPGLGTTHRAVAVGRLLGVGHDAHPLLQPALPAALRHRRRCRPAHLGAARGGPEQPHGPRHQDGVGLGADDSVRRHEGRVRARPSSCCCSPGSCSTCPTIWATPTTTSRPTRSSTPPHIVPEWYFLPYYAILRAIPNKLLGVIAMFSSILAAGVHPLARYLARALGQVPPGLQVVLLAVHHLGGRARLPGLEAAGGRLRVLGAHLHGLLFPASSWSSCRSSA